MARELDYYAWYPADYRADTRHLTREEHFAYREILDEIFLCGQERARLRDDDEYLREICRATPDEWARIRFTLIDGPRAVLTKRGGWIYSSRLSQEIERARVKSKKNRDNANKRWQSERNATALPTQSERNAIRREEKREEEKEEVVCVSGFDAEAEFERIWPDYPDPRGRKEALRHYLASVKSPEDARLVWTALTNYRASDRVKRGYIQNGSTWFNNWRDWLTPAPPKVTHDGRRTAAQVHPDQTAERAASIRTKFPHRTLADVLAEQK